MPKLGLIRVVAASPKLKVADTSYNVKEIIECIQRADKEETAGVILFPELCISGYSCGDLFYQTLLYEQNLKGLSDIAEASRGSDMVIMVGFYFRLEGSFYNCVALIQKGVIKGIVPKMFIPNYKEFYEGRWFSSGFNISKTVKAISLFGVMIPFGNLVFRDEQSDLGFGIEICEDLWMPISPGTHLVLNGADIIFNASASNEAVGKAKYRRNMILTESSRRTCGYVYTSAGVGESTTDLVFGGHRVIAENGNILAEGECFQRENALLVSDVDFMNIQYERTHGQTLSDNATAYSDRSIFSRIQLEPLRLVDASMKSHKKYQKNPFVPEDEELLAMNCKEIFSIQTAALARRMEHTNSKKCVVGISGGLDSTLALLVSVAVCRLLDKPASDIVAITMPGFGTTGKTYNNALTIMKLLGADVREIPIGEAVLKHFKDIGHNKDVHDLTYENSQARERTQILMDIANKEGGLVIGTGDLSEMALGWCTYNGDHMSMYGVNAGIPKTLIRFVVKWIMDNILQGKNQQSDFSSDNELLIKTLQDIVDTPISPELLPPDEKGNITQKTEESIGPYNLHEFFTYYTLRCGTPPKKMLYMAKQAYEDEYDEEFIKKWLMTFYRRFFSQQFKRNCSPDGPKVGAVGMSPRGDWKMPSDADVSIWLAEVE